MAAKKGGRQSGAAGLVAVTVGLVLACSPGQDDPLAPPPGSLLADPLGPFPESMQDVGLYPTLLDLDTVSSVAIGYTPGWPLWSSGSDKARYLVLPAGEVIDNADPEAWSLPVGTLLFKTFGYRNVATQTIPVETRVMRRAADGSWEFAAYQWNEEQDDATLLELDFPVATPMPGGGPTAVHTIPARIECRQCHESSDDPVLGLNELQLAEAGDLSALFERGALAEPPSSEPARIEHPDTITRSVLGWFHGNCVHCHNGGDTENASFDLRADVALANTIDQPTQSSASAAGIRIVPGRPDESILYLAVSGEGGDPEQEDMPPLGIDRRDTQMIARLRGFIESL